VTAGSDLPPPPFLDGGGLGERGAEPFPDWRREEIEDLTHEKTS